MGAARTDRRHVARARPSEPGEFRRLERLGLTMFGQMTARSWIYLGAQGILQGIYELFAAVAAKRFGGGLAGTITLTAGLGGMGGARPLASTMNGGVAIRVECDQGRIARRLEHHDLDERADDLDDAPRRVVTARDAHRPLPIGVLGNAAEVVPCLRETDAPIDIVTDQTFAHDPLTYLPLGGHVLDAHAERDKAPDAFVCRARDSMTVHVEAVAGVADAGAEALVADGRVRASITIDRDLATEKIERVLTNDPATGVIRRVGAGYDEAVEVARAHGLPIPMEKA